jgi:hypothetical protein
VQASELDYDLPPELIAQAPPTERDGARLAIVEIGKGLVQHARVLDLATALRPALFVVNDTRVIPARLFARKLTQGRVELLLVEPVPGETSSDPSVWYALARGAKGLRPGMKLGFDGAPLEATIRALREHGEVEIELQPHGGLSVREAIGPRTSRCTSAPGPSRRSWSTTSTSTRCTPSGTRSPRRPPPGGAGAKRDGARWWPWAPPWCVRWSRGALDGERSRARPGCSSSPGTASAWSTRCSPTSTCRARRCSRW